MTKQETQNYFDQLADAFEHRHAKQVFDRLHALLTSLSNWQLQEKLQSLEETYKTMIRYVADNIEDPEREKIYAGLARSLYQVADVAIFQLKTANDNSLFYERKRASHFYVPETTAELLAEWNDKSAQIALADLMEDNSNNQKLKDLENSKQAAARKLFYTLWLSDLWSSDDKNTWTTLLQPSDDESLPSLLVTALTLSLLELFDERKALLLFEATQNPDSNVRHRALIGIVLFLRKYDRRLSYYPILVEQLNQIAEDPAKIRTIRNTLLQFILSRETEKITHKINSELIPELMKKMGSKDHPIIKPSDWMNDPGLNEKNPEWEIIIEQSGLQDQFREISELQMEGADVMHSSFIHLKNYPFFNEPCHWFLPFTPPAAGIEDPDLDQLARILAQSTLLCNSDKYSFYLSLSQMPQSYRKMMITQFSAESEAVNEIRKDELSTGNQAIDSPTRQYIQDLYRFFKLHPRRNDFDDIFQLQPEFYKVPAIHRLVGDSQSLLMIGEYYFNKNYFDEASDIFDILLRTDPNNEVLHQKKAFSLQMMGQLQDALEAYQKAEFLSPSHSWTLKKLAHLHRLLKNPNEALFYYRKAEQLHPDNLTLHLNIGHCLLELKEYDEAIKHYFKVEYLTQNKEKAWRPIVWTSFLLGKYHQAADYSSRLIAAQPNATDYLNAGHVQLVFRNTAEALRLYRLSLQTSGQTPEAFADTFTQDAPILADAGVDAKRLPFLLDSVFYG